VSKTPVRESLNLLAREGWVDVVPRLGYIVSAISVRDVQDVFQLRLLLEPAAAALAAERISEEQLRGLRGLSRIEYRHKDHDSYSNFLAANREFHTAVARASGNRRLGDLVERLLEEMERFFHLGLGIRDSSGEMVHEHGDLLEALVEGNGQKAAEFMREQVTASRRRIIEAILSEDGDDRALFRVS
jgi:DNA-binding GntR family transcriptional regulator